MVIQRGWKILSDTGSTSASSTEANRSPMGGLNSSSDDSNCSNQTTHSMVTSVASPPNNSTRLETSSTTTNCTNSNHYQQSNEIMKFITTPQMAENTLQKLRQRYSNSTPLTSSSAESAMRSLELVRIAVQSAFDKEIDKMVKHFIEIYFKPAFNNIKENLGQGAINEDALQKMSCALLENAKSQYKILRFKSQISINSGISSSLSNISENNTMRMALKRPAPNKPTLSAFEIQKRFVSDNMVIKPATVQQTPLQQNSQQQIQQQTVTQILPSVATIKSALTQNLHSTAFVQHQQQPHLQQQVTLQPPQQQPHPRRQIFWNTAHISTNTKFVLDVQANQAFGFGPEGKERLASKHPELIRYLPDNEDRDWLINQQIIPEQSRNSRFLFLIYDEVCRLYQSHENYKNKSTIDLGIMMTFSVPEFMIQKMKVFFVDLNIKSRGLITNSYSIVGATSTTIHQQLPQQQQQQHLQQQQSNSHLRNALLLGTQQSLMSSSSNTTAVSSNVATTSDSTTSGALSSSASSSSSNITSTETLLLQKTKSSNLSSSHATLTALLNNSSATATSSSSSASTSTSSSLANTSVLSDKPNNSINLPALSTSTPTLLNKLRK